MPISRPLITFAFVKSEFEKTGDIVQGLMPLFAPIIKKNARKDFSPKEFSKEVNRYYGIELHPYVAEDWAVRLCESGYLHAVEQGGNNIRYINRNIDLPEPSINIIQIDKIIDEFVTYIESGLIESTIKIDREKIESSIFERLTTMEFLNALRKKAAYKPPDNTLRISSTGTEGQKENHVDALEAKLDSLCASHALRLLRHKPADFELLSAIASGALVSEVVLGLRIPPSPGKIAKNLSVYLDAPLVIDALGIADDEECECARMILKELVELGGTLCMFRRSVDELSHVIAAALQSHNNGDRSNSSIGRRLATDQLNIIRIRSILKDLEGALANHSIKIVSFDDEYSDLYKHFPEEREKELVSIIRPFAGKYFPRATDARSVANVVRLIMSEPKKGDLFSAKAVFITKNSGLVRDANYFFRREHFLSEEQAPLFLTDRYTAGLILIAKGGKGDDVPRRKLIANCTAALTPDQDVVDRMISTLNEIDTTKAEEFEALIVDDRCAFYMMERSLGDADSVNPDNALRIFEEVRLATSEEVAVEKDRQRESELQEQEERHDKQLVKIVKVHDEALTAAEEKLGSLAGELSNAEKQTQIEQSRISELEEQVRENEVEKLNICVRSGKRAALIAAAITYALISVMVALAPLALRNFVDVPVGLGAFMRPTYMWMLAGVVFSLCMGQYLFFRHKWFGSILDRVRIWAYTKKVRKVGISEIADRYSVEWDTGHVETK